MSECPRAGGRFGDPLVGWRCPLACGGVLSPPPPPQVHYTPYLSGVQLFVHPDSPYHPPRGMGAASAGSSASAEEKGGQRSAQEEPGEARGRRFLYEYFESRAPNARSRVRVRVPWSTLPALRRGFSPPLILIGEA